MFYVSMIESAIFFGVTELAYTYKENRRGVHLQMSR